MIQLRRFVETSYILKYLIIFCVCAVWFVFFRI